jgi:hypothetical protein
MSAWSGVRHSNKELASRLRLSGPHGYQKKQNSMLISNPLKKISNKFMQKSINVIVMVNLSLKLLHAKVLD